MRIGILADPHEDVGRLAAAATILQQEGIDELVLLGDLVDTATQLDACVELLSAAGAVGMFGNHDLGLCWEPEPELLSHYSPAVVSFMAMLRPSLTTGGCWFGHVEPYLDPLDPMDYYAQDGGAYVSADRLRHAFDVRPERVLFVGHYHTWRATSRTTDDRWPEGASRRLDPAERWLIVVHALCDGHCARFDTDTGELRRYGV